MHWICLGAPSGKWSEMSAHENERTVFERGMRWLCVRMERNDCEWKWNEVTVHENETKWLCMKTK